MKNNRLAASILGERGLSVNNGRMFWRWKGGYLLHYPMWLKRPIIMIWNRIACRIKGHDDFEVSAFKAGWLCHQPHPPRCVYCLKELPMEPCK